MSGPFSEINQELVAITEAHASGQMDRLEFRRRRRALICQATGEAPPAQSEEEVAAQVSEDDTHPKMAAVTVPSPEPGEHSEGADTGDADEDTGSRLSSWKFTILLLLVALAGLGGLLWFILR